VWFEWGIGDNLNQSTAKVTLSQQANQSYVQVLGGLSSNTMYSYRAAVQTVYGVSYGVVRTFTTGTSGAVISGGTTGGSNSNTTPCDCDTDNNPGSAQTETTGDNTSFAKSAIWWLLLILIILVIVGVAHHLWEKRKQIKEEAKRAEAAEKLQREAAVAQQASNGEKEDRITFRLPGQ
jgi:cbb3-type cytochrome oxidase subunit 3